MLLGDRLEIGSELQSHAAYLEHWIALLQAEPQVLFQVLGEARQAVELIAPEGASDLHRQGFSYSKCALMRGDTAQNFTKVSHNMAKTSIEIRL